MLGRFYSSFIECGIIGKGNGVFSLLIGRNKA